MKKNKTILLSTSNKFTSFQFDDVEAFLLYNFPEFVENLKLNFG